MEVDEGSGMSMVLIAKLYLSQLMRWYLSHRRPAKAQVSLHMRAVLPEPSLFTHMKYGSRRRVWHVNGINGKTLFEPAHEMVLIT